jgi:6,7-dimethyl-8-ribityllumazine synthase
MPINIYIIVSDFNDTITHALLDGALKELKKHKITLSDNHIMHVPGCLELPVSAQHIATEHNPDAIIVLGAVIKGNTDHYTHVSTQSMRGIMDVSLKTGVPILNGILTTETFSQAKARAGDTFATNKGAQVTAGALQMIERLKTI